MLPRTRRRLISLIVTIGIVYMIFNAGRDQYINEIIRIPDSSRIRDGLNTINSIIMKENLPINDENDAMEAGLKEKMKQDLKEEQKMKEIESNEKEAKIQIGEEIQDKVKEDMETKKSDELLVDPKEKVVGDIVAEGEIISSDENANLANINELKHAKEKTVKDIKGNVKKNVKDKNEDVKFPGIMPQMPDLEAKQALGRASWKYFHTLLARFPDKPTEDERLKLKNFISLYAELYPCGECSYHFIKLIEKYPVQTSSRTNAAMWGCHIHNKVNAYLKKEEYDCSTILEDYDCGCGPDDESENASSIISSTTKAAQKILSKFAVNTAV